MIIYEDKNFIFLNKKGGYSSQGGGSPNQKTENISLVTLGTQHIKANT
jgi:23S rRNA-/tRNA-specific pseudouridylate synthase